MENTEIIGSLLQHLHPERENSKKIDKEAYAFLDLFTKKNKKTDLADLIYGLTRDHKEIIKIACLIDMLIWLAPDNGNTIGIAMHNWLLSDDKRKVEVTLNLSEGFPLIQSKESNDQLLVLTKKFPELQHLVNARILTTENTLVKKKSS